MYVTQRHLGRNKNAIRLWLDGAKLLIHGFTPGVNFSWTQHHFTLTLEIKSDGYRRVASRPNGKPIIDINNNQYLYPYREFEHVQVIITDGKIVIEPLQSELRRHERINRMLDTLRYNDLLRLSSVAHGGGVLDDAIRAGLCDAGLQVQTGYFNEIRDDFADLSYEHSQPANTALLAINQPLQELAYNDRLLQILPYCHGLTAGLPCDGASVAGRAKRHLSQAEDHPEVGHLIAPFIALIARTNPFFILLENVPSYATSASMSILRKSLTELGYTVTEAQLVGKDFGSYERRKRFVMVAVTQVSFEFNQVVKPGPPRVPIKNLLEPISDDDPRWRPMLGLKEKALRNIEQGKHFAMQPFTEDATEVATRTKDMMKNRLTDPKLQHPNRPDLLRIPTVLEHARIKQFTNDLITMVSKISETLGHQLCGQSVTYSMFQAIGYELGQSLKQLLKPTQVTRRDLFD